MALETQNENACAPSVALIEACISTNVPVAIGCNVKPVGMFACVSPGPSYVPLVCCNASTVLYANPIVVVELVIALPPLV